MDRSLKLCSLIFSIFILALSGCAAPRDYFGVDLTPVEILNQQNPARYQAIQQRNLIMLLALIEGCYERTPQGFKPVDPVDAPSFKCAEMLVEVRNRSEELGLGRSPSGVEAIDLPALASMARAGDKSAQFELGIRFEQGFGLEQDLGKACRLFARAATQSGGTLWIYVPPVGNGTSGRVMPVDQGPIVPGLAAAAARLETLSDAGSC